MRCNDTRSSAIAKKQGVGFMHFDGTQLSIGVTETHVTETCGCFGTMRTFLFQPKLA